MKISTTKAKFKIGRMGYNLPESITKDGKQYNLTIVFHAGMCTMSFADIMAGSPSIYRKDFESLNKAVRATHAWVKKQKQ